MMLAVLDRSAPHEALTAVQALSAYTSGGAFAERQEQHRGKIKPGMSADIAVLSQDILSMPVAQWPSTTSLLTLVNGEVIHEDPSLARVP